jgi:hypothetical protein
LVCDWQKGGELALSDDERALIIEAAQTETAVGENSRFFEAPYELKTGKPVDAAKGLADRMRMDPAALHSRLAKGVDAIEEDIEGYAAEFKLSDGKEELAEIVKYVLYQKTSEKMYPNGVRDKNRNGVRPGHFIAHRNARDADLSEGGVYSLRIYTTFAYKYINDPLRDDKRYLLGEPVPLPSITTLADEAIRKLRSVWTRREMLGQNTALWRGMRNVCVSEDFMHEGGTELAFMSTTSNLRIAVRYSLSRHSLLFKLVAPNFMSLGAELKWLSAFENEEEVLFPPLTYLHPTGRTDRVDAVDCEGKPVTFTVVEVTPSF